MTYTAYDHRWLPESQVVCHEQPDLFFSEIPREVDQAKALCRECPEISECYGSALAAKPDHGVWGGVSFSYGKPKRSRYKAMEEFLRVQDLEREAS